jgi:phosphatidylcholine synthase
MNSTEPSVKPNPQPGPPLTTAAFAVHIFTASGAACALLALIAAVRSDWPLMFIWLGIALFIDGVDGTFARRLHVAEVLPRWSGDVLDLVVDILNYVFVPAYAVAASGLVPPMVAIPLGILIVVTGSLYFADRLMKTSDYYFRGFPAIWNVAVFYLFVLKPQPLPATVSIVMLAVFTFVPFHVVHPMRIAHLREITIVALVVWALLATYAVAAHLDPGFWTQASLCFLAIYFIAIGLLRRRHP